MKLHIGCNNKQFPGWKHADIKPFPHVDFVGDLKDLRGVVGGTERAEEIYACHILEHFSRHDVDDVIANWASVLEPGGRLRLAVPDVGAAVAHYQEHGDLAVLRGLLWGGQRDSYDYHTIGFDEADLRARLEVAGFESVERYDWRDFLPEGADDYSRSYLPHMDFATGRLMSLNVVATKKG